MSETTCRICLSNGRYLTPLREHSNSYIMLLSSLEPPEHLESVVAYASVCWECANFLSKLAKFQMRAFNANLILHSYSESVKDLTYSTLCCTKKIDYDLKLVWTDESVIRDWGTQEKYTEVEVIKVQNNSEDPIEDTHDMEEKIQDGVKKKKIKKRGTNDNILTVVLSENDVRSEWEKRRESEAYIRSPFKCELCLVGFILKEMLNKHQASKHNQENQHVCDICRQTFASAEKLACHWRVHFRRYDCAACQYSSPLQSSVRRHVSECHASSAFQCAQCKLEFTTKRKLRYHTECAHKDPVKCNVCNKTMTNRYSLKHHMLTHTGMPTHECVICHKVYRGEAGLYSHMRHFHSNNSDAYCQQCGIHFKNKTIYRSHLKRSEKHATIHDLRFECDKCTKRFISEASLRKHHRYYHLDYQCHICQKRLKNWFSLDSHVKFVHEGKELQRNHMCEVCGKGYKTNAMLKSHQMKLCGQRGNARLTTLE